MVIDIAERMDKFLALIEEEGEFFMSTGSTEDDYNLVASTIKFNGGYWAGSKYKYFLDDDFNLTDVEERSFVR